MDAHTNGASTVWPQTEAGRRVKARFSEDRTLEALDRLLQRIETLEMAVTNLTLLMRQGPGLVAMAGDMMDEAYRQADAKGVSIDERLGVALQLAEKLTQPEVAEKLDALLKVGDQLPGMMAMTVDMVDEGMRKAIAKGFDPQTFADTASAANTALTKAKAETPAKVGGIFGLLKLIKDPDRQKGLGFLMNFLKHFGRNI